MTRGDQYRLRIADLPVTIRKLRKPQRCIVDARPIAPGDLAGTIAIRKRDGGTWVHRTQYVCAWCVEDRCTFDASFRRQVDESRAFTQAEQNGALPWET